MKNDYKNIDENDEQKEKDNINNIKEEQDNNEQRKEDKINDINANLWGC